MHYTRHIAFPLMNKHVMAGSNASGVDTSFTLMRYQSASLNGMLSESDTSNSGLVLLGNMTDLTRDLHQEISLPAMDSLSGAGAISPINRKG